MTAISHELLISGGTVLTVDPELGDLPRGDVLVRDGLIVAVGPDIPATGAEVVDATGMIVLPGLVDTHRHLWQSAVRQIAADWTLGQYAERMLGTLGPRFTAEDVYIADLMGALECLNGGVTTVLDWSHIMNTPEHADAAVAALNDSGMRAVFAYGAPGSPAADWYAADLARVATTYFAAQDAAGSPGSPGTSEQLVTLALASLGPEFSSLAETARDVRLARELGIPTSLHVGAGPLGQKRAVTGMAKEGLLGPDIVYVHCNTCTDDELRFIADSGGHVSISPRVEMQMGHGYPATGRLIAAGIRPSLSVDVVSGVGGSLFAEMRGTLEAERGWQNHQALSRGEWPGELALTTRDVVRMATLEGARTLGMADRIGSLTPGKRADILLLTVDTPSLGLVNHLPAAVTLSDSENVHSVYVAGRPVKRAGKLLDHDLGALQERLRTSRDRLLTGTLWAPPTA
ncbi:amidohydrolase family protein [Streptomyces sp. NPDC059477]|uniref:amidohydrolase family protein n=1 Tax=Streptomyces sp. NPDC059477 TaxID=3346847 RepID=UPI0036AF7A22